jgi:hypothetical protein
MAVALAEQAVDSSHRQLLSKGALQRGWAGRITAQKEGSARTQRKLSAARPGKPLL